VSKKVHQITSLWNSLRCIVDCSRSYSIRYAHPKGLNVFGLKRSYFAIHIEKLSPSVHGIFFVRTRKFSSMVKYLRYFPATTLGNTWLAAVVTHQRKPRNTGAQPLLSFSNETKLAAILLWKTKYLLFCSGFQYRRRQTYLRFRRTTNFTVLFEFFEIKAC